jgi:tetratricopeptide (TPR) repeat protein
MAYEGDDYKNATKYFDQVSGEEKYKEKLSYFQADMNFKLGNFQIAIDLGLTALVKSNALEKSELNKIIGESYFNLNQYEKAIPYLKQYKGKKGKWNNTDFYQLGFAYYQQNDFENAIAQFNKIIDGKDFVAQNAYYHLGQSYLKTDKKQQALNAFKNASEMVFDLKIQEDAALNYAKLSYDIGNSYQSVPDVLSAFLDKYPNSPSKTDIETLLINSFITSKNYKGALELLEKNKSFANKQAYQIIEV